MLDEEATVDGVVIVLADGNYDNTGHLMLELNEAGKLYKARRTGGGPEVEDDGVTPVFAEFNRLGSIAYGEVWRNCVDPLGMTSAIASGDQQYCEDYTCPDFSHITLHFL